MILVTPLLILLLSIGSQKDNCLSVKTSKEIYTPKDKVLKWTVYNGCSSTKYYLIAIEIKTDTGWSVLNSYVHSLMQKDFLALLTIDANKKYSDQVELNRITKEKNLKK